MQNGPPGAPPKQRRGATFNPANRYHETETVALDDGWDNLAEEPETLLTSLSVDASRSILSRNDSPDIPFDRSINPYRGCEHGCIYCYARPSHAWLGLSPGLDFESRLFYKPDAAKLLRRELGRRGYTPSPVALGANTDAYQPAERRLAITRTILEVLAETRHPVTIITKSALVERDQDLLTDMAGDRLATVHVSLTTLDAGLARTLEPRAASPLRRLRAITALAEAGIPVGVMLAPVIPGLTDAHMERILSAARDAGATFAGYTLLRLPGEVSSLFRDWLSHHHPEKAARVMGILRDTRNGEDNDARFGRRMVGRGPFAEMLGRRFTLACKRLGYGSPPELVCDRFHPPTATRAQMELF
jgi:DNA repair photolyase